jgi:hypothetical protein
MTGESFFSSGEGGNNLKWRLKTSAENTAVETRYTNHVAPSIRKKLALTSLRSRGRSFGKVRSRMQAT